MEPYVGELQIFAGSRVPRGWALCDGTLLDPSGYGALFSLIGTTYGGDGVTTFALPDMRGRVAIHMGQGKGLSNRALASNGGANDVALDPMAIPSHDHRLQGRSAAPTPNNDGTLGIAQIYRIKDRSNPILTELDLSSIEATPPQPATAHENRQPFLTVNFIIALVGIYPSRN